MSYKVPEAKVSGNVQQNTTVTVYDKLHVPRFSQAELMQLGHIGETAYCSPPWGRTTYYSHNACNAIYVGKSFDEALASGTCKNCNKGLTKDTVTPHLIDEFFRKELGFVMRKVEDGEGYLIIAKIGQDIAGIRFAVDYSVVRDEARADAAPFVAKLIDNIGIDPSRINYTIDMFVNPELQKQGIASAMIKAHIDAATRDGYRAMLGWTEDDNINMINRYGAFGFSTIPAEFNVGIDCNPHFEEKKFRVALANQDNARYFLKLLPSISSQ